ncbi:hypothetical protein [Amycolatopsis sp. MtRt-6]|uniref:hypothetical protein n=1 Tax=Amycolatopsis sp. MtRt-6 TaxID=2792782 RepID=UPI001A8E1E25|nr:hypothetical protein [Amycolatopsis sp. MtRt-6]
MIASSSSRTDASTRASGELTPSTKLQTRQIRRIEIGRPKSEASNRVIGLDSATIALIRQYRQDTADDVDPASKEFMFTTRSGSLLHDLRRGAGSLSLAAGNDLKPYKPCSGTPASA